MNKMILQAPIDYDRVTLNQYFNYNYRVPFETLTDVEKQIETFLSEVMSETPTSAAEFELYDIDEFCTAINDEMLNDQDYWYIPVSIMEV